MVVPRAHMPSVGKSACPWPARPIGGVGESASPKGHPVLGRADRPTDRWAGANCVSIVFDQSPGQRSASWFEWQPLTPSDGAVSGRVLPSQLRQAASVRSCRWNVRTTAAPRALAARRGVRVAATLAAGAESLGQNHELFGGCRLSVYVDGCTVTLVASPPPDCGPDWQMPALTLHWGYVRGMRDNGPWRLLQRPPFGTARQKRLSCVYRTFSPAPTLKNEQPPSLTPRRDGARQAPRSTRAARCRRRSRRRTPRDPTAATPPSASRWSRRRTCVSLLLPSKP